MSLFPLTHFLSSNSMSTLLLSLDIVVHFFEEGKESYNSIIKTSNTIAFTFPSGLFIE